MTIFNNMTTFNIIIIIIIIIIIRCGSNKRVKAVAGSSLL